MTLIGLIATSNIGKLSLILMTVMYTVISLKREGASESSMITVRAWAEVSS